MKRNDVVSASEIASWSWCPESWRLSSLGLQPSNQKAMRRGEKFHARAARLEVRSKSAIKLGTWLIAAAVILLALAFVLARS